MKAVQVLLVLCLIASFDCQDIIAQISCLVANPVVYETVKEVVKKIKNKENAIEIGLFIVSKYEAIKGIVEKCFS